MKKILFIVPTLIQTSGVATFVMNYLKEFRLDKFEVEILYNNFNPSEDYLTFLNEHNIKSYALPFIRNTNFITYYRAIKDFFYNHHDYEIIYSNASYQSYLFFKEAKKYGINKIIMHSHATQSSDNKFKNIIGKIIQNKANNFVRYRFACSNIAGQSMFGSCNFEVINNAIDYNKYRYSSEYRDKIRNRYYINNCKKVIGFVGRLSPQKNIFFFIELAKKISDDYVIMMIGKGPLKEDFIKCLVENNLTDKFILVDETPNVNEYYSAFDYFLLPSLYEGLPVVGVEAQVNGLPCFFSNTISDECKISENTIYLDRNDIDKWIHYLNTMQRNENLKLNDDFNIKIQAKNFEKILINLCKE